MKSLARKIRARETPFWNWLYLALKRARRFSIPKVPGLGAILFGIYTVFSLIISAIRIQIVNQIMHHHCTSVGRSVKWGKTLPLIEGSGLIIVGNNVSVGDFQTWVLGMKIYDEPRLTIGDGTTINYRTLISVAKEVSIGKNCTFAGELKIFDNNSHSIDYKRRLKKLPIELQPSDVSPVLIEDNVWIGTQVIILKGVTLGKGCVIAAGSVVTNDIPPLTIAAGNPARVVKTIRSVPQ